MQTPENASPNAEISFGAISEAVEQFKNNAGTWVVAVLIVGVITLVLYGILEAFGLSSFRHSVVIPTTPGVPPVMPNPFAMMPLIFGFGVVGLIINSLLGAGLFRMATKQARGEAISISDLFDFGDVAVQAIIASILIAIILDIGFLLCFLPGLVLTGLLMFTFPLIVDKKMGAVEAISASFNALKGQWLMATFFAIVVGVIYMIGAMLCGIGALVTAPIALLSITILYRNFFISSSSPPSAGQAFEPAIPPGS
jgi:hypothetical protein